MVRRPPVAAPALLPDAVHDRIVVHTDGPLLVVGGPGTGKTTTLAEAVAARVEDGVDPERILVLTFGRRAAQALRERIETRIAGLDDHDVMHQPMVRTFHAYAYSLLRRAAAERGEPSPRLLTGPEQDLVIRELLEIVGDPEAAAQPTPDTAQLLGRSSTTNRTPDAQSSASQPGSARSGGQEPDAEPRRAGDSSRAGAEDAPEPAGDDPYGWPTGLRPALRTRAFATQLRDLMLRAVERGIGPADLTRLGERLGRSDWPAAARFLREYAAVLALRDSTGRAAAAYDAAELVRAAMRLLTDDPELLESERRRLAHVYVDELADTDPAQVALLHLIAGGGLPLVAFADPDSSVYGFRGADPSIVTAFPARFRTASGAPAATVTRTISYRADPALIDAVRRVGRRLRGPITHRNLTPPPSPEPEPVSGVAAAPESVPDSEPVPDSGLEPDTTSVASVDATADVEAAPTGAFDADAAVAAADAGSVSAGGGVATGDAAVAADIVAASAGVAGPVAAGVAGAGVAGAGEAADAAGVAGAADGAAAGAVGLAAGAGGADGLAASAAGAVEVGAAEGGEAEAGDVDALRVRTFRSAVGESAYVAHVLREAHLLGGVPWGRMAVIVRSTLLQLPPLQRALHAAGVPTVTYAEDLPLHLQPAVAPLLLVLRCALEPDALDEDAAVTLLHSPLGGADPLAERRLRQGLRALAHRDGNDRRSSGELIVAVLRDPAPLDGVDRRWARPARAVARLLETVRTAAAEPANSVEDVLWALWSATGLADRWYAASVRSAPPRAGESGHVERARADAADRDLDSVLVLFDAAARFADRLPGARTEVFLDHVLGQDLPADSIAPSADRGDAVRLLTAHAAKGLEWDVVAIAGVQEGVWPDLRLRGSLLGSERLVDLLSGRTAPEAAALAGQTSALLDEERRLFYVAASRARKSLLVTAVESASVGTADGEEQPSRFLHEIAQLQDVPAEDLDLQAQKLPRALTLAALVAELRTALTDPRASEARRRAAAGELARLARAGVPGAHPDEWWGLRRLSDDRPLAEDGEAVRVTPSTMEGALRCSLRWLLERHGGNPPAGPAQGIGNLVHAAAMLAEDANADRERLIDYVAGRFPMIELAARWLAGPEQSRAEGMVDKLLRWLAANPRRLLAIEHEFAVRLDDGTKRPIDLVGRVDRLEVDDAGRLVVVDLKTGRSTAVTAADVAEHPQLAGYQAAVEAGGFADFGLESGGAALVQLGTETKAAREQSQAAVADSPDPGWAEELVRRTADTMAASTFSAVVNKKCRTCPVQTACPVSGRGRQVVEPPTRRPGT
nr:ATP-dependent DNA helicase [Catenuloplanes nepalensis]